MIAVDRQPRWITDKEIAALLHLNPGTIRTWRMLDSREGRGTAERPGRGGLVYRRFGRAVRYLLVPELLGQGDSDVRR